MAYLSHHMQAQMRALLHAPVLPAEAERSAHDRLADHAAALREFTRHVRALESSLIGLLQAQESLSSSALEILDFTSANCNPACVDEGVVRCLCGTVIPAATSACIDCSLPPEPDPSMYHGYVGEAEVPWGHPEALTYIHGDCTEGQPCPHASCWRECATCNSSVESANRLQDRTGPAPVSGSRPNA
jgi:hypothetical protein